MSNFKIEKDLKDKLDNIINLGWIKTSRKLGDACLGNSIEDLLGKKEDNLSIADYFGFEIKTKNIKSKSSLITLFSKSPLNDICKIPANTYLRKEFGSISEDNFKRLNTTVSGKNFNSFQNEFGFKANVDFDEKKIFLQIKDLKTNEILNESTYWSFATIEKPFTEKIKNICLIMGETKKEGNDVYVKYSGFDFYYAPMFNDFAHCIDNGKVLIDIRIGVYISGKKYGQTHDHGTAFRINQNDFYEMFSKDKKDSIK